MTSTCPVAGCGAEVITVIIGGQPVTLTPRPYPRGVIAARELGDGTWAGRYLAPGKPLAEGEARYCLHQPRCGGAVAAVREALSAAAHQQRARRGRPAALRNRFGQAAGVRVQPPGGDR
jgi:hypothetical protein